MLSVPFQEDAMRKSDGYFEYLQQEQAAAAAAVQQFTAGPSGATHYVSLGMPVSIITPPQSCKKSVSTKGGSV
jgi:hypothetical protein